VRVIEGAGGQIGRYEYADNREQQRPDRLAAVAQDALSTDGRFAG
jgi:hypothetical protein